MSKAMDGLIPVFMLSFSYHNTDGIMNIETFADVISKC